MELVLGSKPLDKSFCPIFPTKPWKVGLCWVGQVAWNHISKGKGNALRSLLPAFGGQIL